MGQGRETTATREGFILTVLPLPQLELFLPEKASGSDGIEPGTLGKGWTMVSVKPAYLALLLLQHVLLLSLLFELLLRAAVP